MLQEPQHNSLPLEEIIDIRDPAVDVEAVMEQIRASIRQRRIKAEAEGVGLEELEGLSLGQIVSFDHDTYHNLRRLNISYSKTNVGLFLTASRVPVVGALWQKIRRNFHHLVLFYANMVASKQAVFNKYVVHTFASLVKGLVEENERMKVEINALQARVVALETMLEHLEGE